MNSIDVIGIGAINFDYMFYCKKLQYKNRPLPEAGQEYLVTPIEVIYDEISTLIYTTKHDIQICGSSYFAIKTIAAISPAIKTAYVGVCGKPTDKELKAGFANNIEDEFQHLHNKEWLFFVDDPPGIALVRLYKGTRSWIDINAGANNKLVNYIKKREATRKENGTANAFLEYLLRARWIHISSLADFSQFEYIISRVGNAKKINPNIRVSIDPGYEYTKKYRLNLTDAFTIADFVFLNNNEVSNLIGNDDLSLKDKYNHLATIFNKKNPSNTQVIIIKGKAKHILINFINGKPFSRTFWHKKLSVVNIHNDTGSGDAFAGGFIAGMLSNNLLTHQPAPIMLGAVVAASRMKAKGDPYILIRLETEKFLISKQNNEQQNFKQKLKLLFEDKLPIIISLIIGIITGIISTFIYSLISLRISSNPFFIFLFPKPHLSFISPTFSITTCILSSRY